LGTTRKIKKGVLLKYIRSVSSASTGCVTNRSINLKINSKTLKWIPFDFELKLNFNVDLIFLKKEFATKY
jgi:hypothetical protein